MIDIKANIQPGMVVTFSHYFDGDLWYETQDGNKFPVPASDLGTATVKREEKASFFMRYMRKWNDTVSENENPMSRTV
jgi:hypothetical protein